MNLFSKPKPVEANVDISDREAQEEFKVVSRLHAGEPCGSDEIHSRKRPAQLVGALSVDPGPPNEAHICDMSPGSLTTSRRNTARCHGGSESHRGPRLVEECSCAKPGADSGPHPSIKSTAGQLSDRSEGRGRAPQFSWGDTVSSDKDPRKSAKHASS